MTFYRSHIPAQPLARYIERFWMCSDVPALARERILPSGTFELVIDLANDSIRIYDPASGGEPRRFPGAIISGPYARPIAIDGFQHKDVIGVHFRPGGAQPFLGRQAGELTGLHTPLEDLWGRHATTLRERLLEANSPGQRFRLVEQALLGRLTRAPLAHPAVDLALCTLERGPLSLSMRQLASSAGLSQRRFIQVFTEKVGLTPKLYQRIRRFQRTLEFVQISGHPRWMDAALECGYYDQSHLIRDFVEFSGLTPEIYFHQKGSDTMPNHVREGQAGKFCPIP